LGFPQRGHFHGRWRVAAGRRADAGVAGAIVGAPTRCAVPAAVVAVVERVCGFDMEGPAVAKGWCNGAARGASRRDDLARRFVACH
jgi:hypothetical protein